MNIFLSSHPSTLPLFTINSPPLQQRTAKYLPLHLSYTICVEATATQIAFSFTISTPEFRNTETKATSWEIAKQLLIEGSGIAREASFTFWCTQRPTLKALPFRDLPCYFLCDRDTPLDKDAMLMCAREDVNDERLGFLNKERPIKKVRNKRHSIKVCYSAIRHHEHRAFLDLWP
jgi:hypothetical protein